MPPATTANAGFYASIDSLLQPEPVQTASFGSLSKSEESQECPICLDPDCDQRLYRLKDCGHVFHKDCLTEWLQCQTTCPLCRAMLHAAIELRYRGHYSVENKSATPKAMHSLLHRLIDKVASAGMFSKFNRCVRGGFNCDSTNIIFTTREGLSEGQPPRHVVRLFKRSDPSPEDSVNIDLGNMREIYCRGRYCLLASFVPGQGTDRYRVHVFDAGNSNRAAAVFSKLREVCEPRSYIRGVRYE
ncbi:hypothetical protein PTSG_00026 [Salpingoeca rosetta]|uniref:RING-type domain-containing protein n=1 Tax=Salpingoeca rosetta (strain ATCC 50818 / BSB-021) TaxID=946362 RepID=F2TVB4_SALR5|nr:uncharacterized protein PTSG_00026 [Salpingoeca rosetta]EGD72010.1 hypothetical protein PTSG_00026 [Salpingoeca rosetta]|eukprot:XP_004998582.1 hypothetical protein PTSG_00026 [Salpingoeca rosetta]